MPDGLGRHKDFMVITALRAVLSLLLDLLRAGCRIKGHVVTLYVLSPKK